MIETCVLEPRLNPDIVLSETDLLAAAIHIDRYVMEAINRLIEDFSGINALTMQTFTQLSRNKHRLNDKILSDKQVLGDDVAINLEKTTSFNEQMEEQASTATLRLQRLCACCESSVIFYDAIVEKATDESVLSAASELATTAQERLSVLKQALGKECGCDSPVC